MYRQQRPDGVLLDVAMPGFDGFSTLQALREVDPGARVAMLTSHHEYTVVQKAVEMGVVDYVAKPFQRERLLAAVERLVGKQG
jgi:YesN/AraC family two-component response regulator